MTSEHEFFVVRPEGTTNAVRTYTVRPIDRLERPCPTTII